MGIPNLEDNLINNKDKDDGLCSKYRRQSKRRNKDMHTSFDSGFEVEKSVGVLIWKGNYLTSALPYNF